MVFTDILSLVLSFAIVFSLRFLFPCNIMQLVSTSFEEAGTLLQHAGVINTPNVSEYRANLAMHACPHPSAVSPSTDTTQAFLCLTLSKGTPGDLQQPVQPVSASVQRTKRDTWW
jgi:hypothetical protein